MGLYENVSDEELILRIRRNEDGVMEYLLEKYKDIVLKKARAMFLIGGETDDLIQEGMMGLFKAIRDYKPEYTASFATFANLCIDRQLYTAISTSKRKKHQPLNTYVSLNDEEETAVLGLQTENPESIILEEEGLRDLKDEIYRSLSPLECKVLDYYLQGYSYTRIAQVLDRTPKSIDNALHRIREKTHKLLS